jgi:hypothetical protein
MQVDKGAGVPGTSSFVPWYEVEGFDPKGENAAPPDKGGKTAAQRESEALVKSYRAVHKGGPWFSIIDNDGIEVVGKLSKENAENFNGLADADKLQYVEARKGQAE